MLLEERVKPCRIVLGNCVRRRAPSPARVLVRCVAMVRSDMAVQLSRESVTSFSQFTDIVISIKSVGSTRTRRAPLRRSPFLACCHTS